MDESEQTTTKENSLGQGVGALGKHPAPECEVGLLVCPTEPPVGLAVNLALLAPCGIVIAQPTSDAGTDELLTLAGESELHGGNGARGGIRTPDLRLKRALL